MCVRGKFFGAPLYLDGDGGGGGGGLLGRRISGRLRLGSMPEEEMI